MKEKQIILKSMVIKKKQIMLLDFMGIMAEKMKKLKIIKKLTYLKLQNT